MLSRIHLAATGARLGLAALETTAGLLVAAPAASADAIRNVNGNPNTAGTDEVQAFPAAGCLPGNSVASYDVLGTFFIVY
jgi:hypothetical protein